MRKVLALVIVVSALFATSCHRESEYMKEASGILEDVFGATELPEDKYDEPLSNEDNYYMHWKSEKNDRGMVSETHYLSFLTGSREPSEGNYGFLTVEIFEYRSEGEAQADIDDQSLLDLSYEEDGYYSIEAPWFGDPMQNQLTCAYCEGDIVVVVTLMYTDDLDASATEKMFEFCNEIGMDHPEVTEMFERS